MDGLNVMIVRFKDAAKVLGVSAQTVRNYAKTGVVHAVLVPGRSRAIGITKASLDAFAERFILKPAVAAGAPAQGIASEPAP